MYLSGVEAFHQFMQARARSQPSGLSATTTHDTGAAARMRGRGMLSAKALPASLPTPSNTGED